MIQNERKEPTFDETETKDTKVSIPSLHTTQSPGYTFTPVIKPIGAVKSELPKMEGGDSAQPAGFTASPVESSKENSAKVETQIETVEETEELITGEKSQENKESVAGEQEPIKVTINAAERVIPIAASADAIPEKKQKENSPKHRRLGIVAILAATLGAIFFWLKPNTPETVEELQAQQGGNLPIEFRPVDEAEAQRQEAEARAQAQAQAQAQQEALAQQSLNQQQTQPVAPQPVENTESATEPTVQPVANELAQPQIRPQISQPSQIATEKSKIQIYHSEVQTVSTAPRVERVKASLHANNKQAESLSDTKKTHSIQTNNVQKSVDTGKSTLTQAVTSKTLTVPKGVSLMQVFRDNQLNISDVNAMSKVNNKVSSLKVNEKVTVRLDKNNRVVEMTIGSGGKFTRQTDGTYRFK